MNDPNKICEVSIDEWFDYPSLINYHGPSSIINILSFINLVDQAVASEKILRLIVNKGSFQALNAVFLATAYKLIKFGSQNLKNKQLSEPNAISRRAKIFSRQVEPIVKLLRPRVYKTEGSQPAGIHDPSITINDCLEGLQTFIFQLNLINLKNLDIYQMSKLESAEGGDMNWIIPDKILAFAGPSKDRMTVEQLRNYCLENNVDSIFRLNVDADYDENILHQSNINHHDIAIRDGGIPTRDQIEHFINLVDKLWTQNKAFGVHCWAGLGRTGTMIAAFLIRKFRLRAAPVIAFLRLMRPGSVLSVQGHFLHHIEAYLRMEVSEYSSFDKFMNDE